MQVPNATQGQPATCTYDDAWENVGKAAKKEVTDTWEKTSEIYKKQSKGTSDQVITDNVHLVTDPSKRAITSITPTPLVPLAQVCNNAMDPVVEQSTKASAHKAIDCSVDTGVIQAANQTIDTGVRGSKTAVSWGYTKVQTLTGWFGSSSSEKKS